MKIEAFNVRTVLVPMAPHRSASGVVVSSPLVLLTIRTANGVEGNSVLFTYGTAALKPCADLLRNLEELVKGKELAPTAITDELYARFRLLGTQGLLGMAISGIDMALWDALARSKQMPLHALLGGFPRPLKYYGGVGFDGAFASAKAAEEWAKRGAKGIKAKIGYPTLQEDVQVIREMRSAMGPDIALMVDYNQSIDPAEARRRLAVLDREGLEWIEEPVVAHDFAALVRLAERTTTPLQAGENWWGPLDFRHAVDRGVRDLLMADVMKCGGVTGWMRIAAIAHARSISLSNHLWPEISAQLMMVTPTAGWFEYADWWNPILEEPLIVDDKGFVNSSGLPGSGVQFNEEAVERYAT